MAAPKKPFFQRHPGFDLYSLFWFLLFLIPKRPRWGIMLSHFIFQKNRRLLISDTHYTIEPRK